MKIYLTHSFTTSSKVNSCKVNTHLPLNIPFKSSAYSKILVNTVKQKKCVICSKGDRKKVCKKYNMSPAINYFHSILLLIL